MKRGMAFTVDTGKGAHRTNEPGYQMVSGIMNLRRNLCDSAGSLLPNTLSHILPTFYVLPPHLAMPVNISNAPAWTKNIPRTLPDLNLSYYRETLALL